MNHAWLSVIYAVLVMPLHQTSLAETQESDVYHSEQEAAHVGQPFPDPDIVRRFRASSLVNHASLAENDMMAHHLLIKRFCKRQSRSPGAHKCTWREYYNLLNFFRKPFLSVYDPGIDKIGRAASALQYPERCEILKQRPSADDFFQYVSRNRPFVLRGEGKHWGAFEKWNKSYLKEKIGETMVSISVSETGDFVGPEPLSRWGSVTGEDPTSETVVLARPAVATVPFSMLMNFYDYFQAARSLNNLFSHPSLYMEYMPLPFFSGTGLMNDIPNFYWSHFLNPKMLLLWLGGGGSRKNGRLHFDNFENLMTVIRGKKTFILYDPEQSIHLYADQLLRSASLQARYDSSAGIITCEATDSDCRPTSIGEWIFSRNPNNVNNESSRTHTYSPVDVLNPDFEKFPLLKFARGFNCTLHEGDMIYVPSSWWHEVVTDDDDEGISVGINYFFEPYFVRRRDLKSVFLHENRMYAHLREGVNQTAELCAGKYICFKSTGTSKKKRRRRVVPDKIPSLII